MRTRRGLWVLISVLSVLVLAGSATVGWMLLRPRNQPIRLVVTGNDDQLRMLQADGTERVLESKVDAQEFRFPAVSADGRKLAYVVADGDTMRIMRLDLTTNERVELYHSTIRKPLDIAWSPDGRYIIFLAANDNGLSTHIVPNDGSQTLYTLANGKEAYFAWSPDSSTVLLHVDSHMVYGGHVDVYQPSTQQGHSLFRDPGFFQAPAWSIDGKHLFYVAQPPFPSSPSSEDVQGDIVRVTAEGNEPQVLASEKRAEMRMVRAPTSDLIAYIALQGENSNDLHWGALKLVDGATGKQHVLSPPDAHVICFFWSPDGKRIAYETHVGAYPNISERTWHIVDIDTGTVQDGPKFTPSASFAGLERFFDAYLYALSPWSPDGTRLAYGTDDGVYVLDLASNQTTRAASGTMSVWVGSK